jgi:hypothetical protein
VFLIAAYQDVYHLAERMDQLLVPPFDGIGQRIVTTGMTDAEAQAAPFTKFARDVMQPQVIQTILNDPDAPIARAMRANETYDWLPRTPLRMYYGSADVVVGPRNTLITLERMRELGAPDIDAIELVGLSGEPLTHATAQWPAYIAARRWFDTFPVPVDNVDEDHDEP